MKVSRIVGALALAGGVAFGFVGGEYSTGDWRTLGRELAAETEAIERLEAEIDSLRGEAEALENDSLKQEREARERFGMLRPGELMYRVQRDSPPRPPEP